jgi:periplasmic protein TonB
MEVSLTAAPAEPVAEEAMPEPQLIEEPAEPEPDSMPLLQHQTEEQKAPVVPSPIPGNDKTTFYSAGGAITEAKPNYLKNPAPHYPPVARQNGWEGLVVLKVSVDKTGYPTQVEKETGSGYDALDESALKAVRKWKFLPAQLGALPVSSIVRVPVRFRLDGK